VEPLRIGVLGAARITELSLVGPAHATGHRLVAVAARDRPRAEAFAAAHKVERVVDSYAALLTDPEVEVVYNPLANALHGPWNLAAIRAGKHVLTEKPSASDAEEAREVRDAAATARVSLMEGFHYPYHPLHRRLHELVASGELGEPRAVEISMVMLPPDDDDPRWRLDLAGGGTHGRRLLRAARPADARVGARRRTPGGGRAGGGARPRRRRLARRGPRAPRRYCGDDALRARASLALVPGESCGSTETRLRRRGASLPFRQAVFCISTGRPGDGYA
jgi:hypothetical protein